MQTSNVVLLLISFSAVAAVVFNALAHRMAHSIAALFARLEGSYTRRVHHLDVSARRRAGRDSVAPQHCG
jgi:hypothetical protein